MVQVMIDSYVVGGGGCYPVKIYIDGEEAGTIRENAPIVLDMETGVHEFYAVPPSGWNIGCWLVDSERICGNPSTLEITDKTKFIYVTCYTGEVKVMNVRCAYKQEEEGEWKWIGTATKKNDVWILEWDTTKLKTGKYVLKAVVEDSMGRIVEKISDVFEVVLPEIVVEFIAPQKDEKISGVYTIKIKAYVS